MALTHDDVRHWVQEYERLWRTAGTDGLGALFASDASYLPSPWADPLDGLDALAGFWESERRGPDEEFTLVAEVVAVDGPVAVVHVDVDYAGRDRWRDLWVLRFGDDGRVTEFEEWPFAPDTPDGHGPA